MVSGLSVIFFKSKVIGINLSPHFLSFATNFLCYRIEEKDFIFLGLPMGLNSGRISSWVPLLKKNRDHLSCWKGRFLSLGGRITLVKLVLSSLSIFHLSFYSASKTVCFEINMIQRRFLWGGVEDQKKNHWVAWKYVCLQVEKGGLGLTNTEDFNAAHLSKWKWRILRGKESKCMEILTARYGNVSFNIQNESIHHGNSSKSTWWKDLLSMDKGKKGKQFMAGCRFAVGNGK